MTFGLSSGSDDRSALTSNELVVLDGANGVTQAPRLQFPDAAPALMVAFVALVITSWVIRKRPSWVNKALPLVLALAAIPGMIGVFVLRADAPLNRPALARAIEAAIGEIKANAPWPQPINVVHEDDDVLSPIARYAIPTRAAQGLELEIRGSKLEAVCRNVSNRVMCAP